MSSIYKEDFSNWSDVISSFGPPCPEQEPSAVFAGYWPGDYSGSADVIYRDDAGQWWHASGGHCSCYGLEGMFNPDTFDPLVHLQALAEGRRVVGWDDVTNAEFDSWLRGHVEVRA